MSELWGRCLQARALKRCQHRKFSYTLLGLPQLFEAALEREVERPPSLGAPFGHGPALTGETMEASGAAGGGA